MFTLCARDQDATMTECGRRKVCRTIYPFLTHAQNEPCVYKSSHRLGKVRKIRGEVHQDHTQDKDLGGGE